MDSDQRNFLLAIVLTLGIFVAWDSFVTGPQRRNLQSQLQSPSPDQAAPVSPSPVKQPRLDLLRDQKTMRIAIDAPSVDGSIWLKGALIDDLSLKHHFTTVARSQEVALLSPEGSDNTVFYAMQGWAGSGQGVVWPGQDSLWTAVSTGPLGPESPLVLEYLSDGLRISRTIEIDQSYMFTITDHVENTSTVTLNARPFALARQYGLPEGHQSFYILHEGVVGALDNRLRLLKFKAMSKGKSLSVPSLGGWLGLSSKYWMTTLIPDQSDMIVALARAARRVNGTDVYEIRYDGSERQLLPGESLTYRGRIFAGAKRVSVLEDYQKELGLQRFSDAVDWGNFWFFTKPFFWALNFFNSWLGNFGLAILALTVLVKLAFFPLQNAAYASIAKMRKIMPKMEEIRTRFASDKQRQQKEILALYQQEKANPLAGCLPVIPQIFVFYALYKTLFVTLEMRHVPFYGWIQDLSAPDTAYLFNLFGLLPYDPSSIPLLGTILAVGVWPILYGLSMWALQSLSPPPPDPTQRAIMKFLPLVFTFIFAGFAVGLVIYWTWSNILSIAQQYYVMRRHGVETSLDKFFGGLGKKHSS